jgi:uncharacterized membrane protein
MNYSATTHMRGARGSNDRSVAGQRWGALLGGGALAVYGLSRRSPLGLALAASGGALLLAGANVARSRSYPRANASVIINASPEEVYRFWRDFENLPGFMRHLDSVNVLDDRRSQWTAIGPMGVRVRWTAEIINDQPNRSISWRSTPGSEIEVHGTVYFRPAIAGRGTIVEADISYGTPVGNMGRSLMKIVGKDPRFLMEQDLRRLKALMEAGELPTTEGQPHGPRGVMTGVARVMDPDQPYRRDVSMRELVERKRRAS